MYSRNIEDMYVIPCMYPISGLAITKAHKIYFKFSLIGIFFYLKIAKKYYNIYIHSS